MVIVSEYIFVPWKHAQERAVTLTADDGVQISCTPSVTLAGAATIEAEDVLFLRDKVMKLSKAVYTLAKCSKMRRSTNFCVSVTGIFCHTKAKQGSTMSYTNNSLTHEWAPLSITA